MADQPASGAAAGRFRTEAARRYCLADENDIRQPRARDEMAKDGLSRQVVLSPVRAYDRELSF